MTQLSRFTCEDAFRRLNDYLDRELSAAEMRLVKAHLDTCVRCASEYHFESTVLNEVRRKLNRVDLPADLVSRINAALEAERGSAES